MIALPQAHLPQLPTRKSTYIKLIGKRFGQACRAENWVCAGC